MRSPANSVRCVMLAVFANVFAGASLIPLLPGLAQQASGGGRFATAQLLAAMGVTFAVAQFISGPVWGVLSDRLGRRPVLALSSTGLALSVLWLGHGHLARSMLGAEALAGLSAGTMGAAMATVADVLPPAERMPAFGLINAAAGLAFVVGPAGGGLLAAIRPDLPFIAGSAFLVLATACVVLVLPESLPATARASVTWRALNPVHALALLGTSRTLLGLSGCAFLSMLAQQALVSIFAISAMTRFGWRASEVGLLLMTVGICQTLVMTVGLRWTTRALGERRTVALGLVAGMCGFLVLAAARSGLSYVAAIPLVALWGLAPPGVAAGMSRGAPAERQGSVQGARMSLAGIAGTIGPFIFTGSLGWTFRHAGGVGMQGLPFLLAALLLLGALGLALLTGRPAAAAWPRHARRARGQSEAVRAMAESATCEPQHP